MKTKTCSKCNETFPLTKEYFHAGKGRKDGFTPRCKGCRNKENAKYYQQNKDSCNAKSAKYQRENKESIKEQTARYRRENKEAINECQARYRRENKEAIKERSAKYRRENKEAIKECHAKYRRENKEAVKERHAKRRATKLQATPTWFSDHDRQVFINLSKECKRLESETGVKHHVDHIIPLRGKLVSGLHCANNFQILTESENISKHNRFDPNTHVEPIYGANIDRDTTKVSPPVNVNRRLFGTVG